MGNEAEEPSTHRPRPSPVGARLGGDDYQYLLVWTEAVKILDPQKDVILVEFEALDAGNVDDLVVRRSAGPGTYHQIKFAVTPHADPLDSAWFIKPTSKNGSSPLQKFCDSYKKLGSPQMYLVTNRPIAAGDPILTETSGHDALLGRRLRAEKPDSPAGKALAEWAEHVGLSVADLLEALDHLYVNAGSEPYTKLRSETASLQMRAAQMSGHPNAVDGGTAEVRDLVKTGVRKLAADDVKRIADERDLWAEDAETTLLIEQAVSYPWREAPTATVDWRPYFADDEEEKRRELGGGYSWEDDLRPLMRAGVEAIHATGVRRVRVTGSPRLSGWFLAGFEFRHVHGLQVAGYAGPERWASDAEMGDAHIEVAEPVILEHGEALAVVLSVAQMAANLAEAYIRDAKIPVSELVEISVAGAPDNQLVQGPEHARAIVQGFYGKIAELHQGRDLHLFMAIPGVLALLLGHRWNRMPQTQLYDDRGPQPTDGQGYDPAFLLATS